MLYQFNCIDIDGVMRLKMDLEIVCWKTDHKFFTYYLALPSLIVWGLGLPILAFSLLTMNRAQIMKAHKQTQESYGFLFAGLKSDFYFWEIVITLRKLCLLAISILVIHYGVLTQALIVLLVLILFLVLTARKRPFINEALFDLEAISIATAMISVYCGLFYLADTSQIGFTNADRSSDVTFDLAEGSKKFLLASIIIVNAVFFIYWLWRVFSEMEALKGFILKTFPTLYLLLFTCGDKDQAYVDKHRQQVLDDNEGHKEEFMKILNNMKQLYSKGDLLLNTQVMERLRLYMNPQKILQIAGVVDSHDVELAKKIQEQLFRQYGVQVNNSNLTTFAQSGRQDGASFDKAQHKKSTIGSLLTEQYNEQAMMNTPQVVQEESVNYEDQNRYLNVLAALRNSQQEKEDFNPQKNNNQLYGDLLDFKYLDSQSAQSKGNQNQQMVSFRSKLDEIQNGQDQSSRYENASQAYNRQRSIPNSEFDGVVKHRTRMLSHIDSFKPPGTASTTAEKQIRQTNAFMRRSLITDEGRLIDEELESQQLDTREEGMKDTLSVQDSQAQVILPKKGGQQTALTKQNGTGLLIETGYPFE